MKTLDLRSDHATMLPVGREDRALLRSNPSARPMPEDGREPRPSYPGSFLLSHLLAIKRKTSSLWRRHKDAFPFSSPTGQTYVYICGVRREPKSYLIGHKLELGPPLFGTSTR